MYCEGVMGWGRVAAEANDMTARPKVVAIVDDEESVRRALARLVRSAGYEAQTFASGEDFLAAAPTTRPDCAIIILDMHLPGLSGLDVQARLRLLPPPPIPTIAVTGHDAPGLKARVLAEGARAYLLKPLDDSVLLGIIDSAMADASSDIA